MVPMISTTERTETISALQLKRGAQKGRSGASFTALVSLEEQALPNGPVEQVFNEFADIMPEQLPKALPPRRAVDHRIELEPGTRLHLRHIEWLRTIGTKKAAQGSY